MNYLTDNFREIILIILYSYAIISLVVNLFIEKNYKRHDSKFKRIILFVLGIFGIFLGIYLIYHYLVRLLS